MGMVPAAGLASARPAEPIARGHRLGSVCRLSDLLPGVFGFEVVYQDYYTRLRWREFPASQSDDFTCPQCGAEYKVVRMSPQSVLAAQTVKCLHCPAEFMARNGDLILKYFLLKRPARQAQIRKVPTEARIGRMA
jgi:predicted Zn finger-like uncharacterized protein